MQHRIKFKNLEEKIKIWLDLCDFCFALMKNSLPSKEFKKRLKKIREAHLEKDLLILSKLAKL